MAKGKKNGPSKRSSAAASKAPATKPSKVPTVKASKAGMAEASKVAAIPKAVVPRRPRKPEEPATLKVRATKSKPLAAYELGHHVWLMTIGTSWEMLDVTLEELLAAIHRLRRLFAELQTAIDILAGDLPAGSVVRLQEVSAQWKKGLDLSFSCALDDREQGQQETGGVIPIAPELWEGLRSVAEAALLSNGRHNVWFRLGTALGRYEAELLLGYPTHDIRPVLDQARRICSRTTSKIPEVQQLAGFADKSEPDKTTWAGQRQILVEALQPVMDQTDGPPADAPSSLSALARALDERLRPRLQGVAEDVEGDDSWEAGYLELRFGVGPQLMHVRRDGFGEIPPLTKLDWGLLNYLSAKAGTPASYEDLLSVWTGYKWPRPKLNSVTTAINKLSGKIKPLGLSIEAIRGVGWTIVVLASDAPRSPTPSPDFQVKPQDGV